MGFLERSTGTDLNFNKVTISLWFRIPSDVVAAVQAADDSFSSPIPTWGETVPLLTWGAQLTGAYYDNVTTTSAGSSSSIAQGPSFIGVQCQAASTPKLTALIQTNANAACTATNKTGDIMTGDIDISFVDEAYYDCFGLPSTTEVTADAWHHLLISWDLSGGSASHGDTSGSYEDGFDSTSLMYASLDDVNKTIAELPMNYTNTGPNSHASYVTTKHSGLTNIGLGTPSVSLTVGTIPAAPVHIPAPATIDIWNGSGYSSSIVPVQNVQIAELQIFTDVLLDTGVEANRRAFITAESHPANPSLAVTLMGKSPEVWFQTADDWFVGSNTGTAGNFTETGTISSYTPAP